MKVYIQYPLPISDSQYYRSLVENPPEEVEYVNIQRRQGMIVSPKKLAIINFFKKYTRKVLEKTQLSILNIHKTKTKEKYNLIHAAHCLSKNKTNWICDFESMWQMWISGRNTEKGREKALKILMMDNCKKILAWTNDCENEIILKFPEIRNKVSIVSYAMQLPKFKKTKHKEINLLFVSRYFYGKGGDITLEVFDKLTKKYENVKCIFISQTPKKFIQKYSSNKKIEFFNLMSHQKLIEEIFPKSDILIYSGFSDTFGFIFVEAQAYGIPIVTVDGFARKDIVNEGKTGFVIERDKNSGWYPNEKEGERIINEMVEKTSLLIEDEQLRNKMSINGRKTVTEGKFSIKRRNEKLKKIYEEAIK